jgi:hypothetical protein
MRQTFAAILIASILAVCMPARAQDKTALLASTGKALEDQLACLAQPKPALAIRAMMRNGLVQETQFGSDGIPVFRPKGNLVVFGKRVLFIAGWEMEGDRVREPFSRGPGTSPPLHIQAILDAAPADVPYKEHMVRGSDGTAIGSFSSIKPTSEFYTKGGTTITCYGN